MQEKDEHEYSDNDEETVKQPSKNKEITIDVIAFKYCSAQYSKLDQSQELVDSAKIDFNAHITLAVAQFVKGHGFNPHVFFNANWMVKLYLALNPKPKEQHKIFAFVCAYICMKLERQDGKIEPSLLGYFNDFVKPDDYIFLELDIMRTLGESLIFPNEYTALDLLLNSLHANNLRETSVLFLTMSTMMKRTTPIMHYVFASVWLAMYAEKSPLPLDKYLDFMKYDKEKVISAAAKIMYILIVLCKKSAQKPDLTFLIPITAEYLVPMLTPIKEVCQTLNCKNAEKIAFLIDEYIPTLTNEQQNQSSEKTEESEDKASILMKL